MQREIPLIMVAKCLVLVSMLSMLFPLLRSDSTVATKIQNQEDRVRIRPALRNLQDVEILRPEIKIWTLLSVMDAEHKKGENGPFNISGGITKLVRAELDKTGLKYRYTDSYNRSTAKPTIRIEIEIDDNYHDAFVITVFVDEYVKIGRNSETVRAATYIREYYLSYKSTPTFKVLKDGMQIVMREFCEDWKKTNPAILKRP